MPHLGKFRKGWESENIARFILYKISFIAHPATIADDVGSDFFCTLFHSKVESGNEYLIPRSSFAIQIKSNTKSFDVSNKIGYLNNLELPFFVGVVERDNLKLKIYSGEYIPAFFSYKGIPKSLKIELCEKEVISGFQDYLEEAIEGQYKIRFPRLVDINADDHGEDLQLKAEILEARSQIIYENIISKRKCEYLFKDIIGTETYVSIIAGSGSYNVYRNNLVERLAEAFVNLRWILLNEKDKFIHDEFLAYEQLFNNLKRLEAHYVELPGYLHKYYSELKDLVNNMAK